MRQSIKTKPPKGFPLKKVNQDPVLAVDRNIFHFFCKKCGFRQSNLKASELPVRCPHCSANKIPIHDIRRTPYALGKIDRK